MLSLEELRKAVKGEIRIGVPMSEHTTFKIGGLADFVIEPLDKEDAVNAIAHFQKNNKPFIVLGKGSNVLISDEGLRIPVLFLEKALSKFEIKENAVYAESGVDLGKLSIETLKQRLSGLEMLAGIPGTIGGSLKMNAGAHGQEIFDVFDWVEICRNAEKKRLKKKEIKFGYRTAAFDNAILIAAHFTLKKLSEEAHTRQLKKRKENLEKRRLSQPLTMPNAGCIFKNVVINGQVKSAGAIIDECGLKGMKYGQAMVSERHANFIVNLGGAKASDVVSLIHMIKSKVKACLNIELDLEIRMMGFDRINIQNMAG